MKVHCKNILCMLLKLFVNKIYFKFKNFYNNIFSENKKIISLDEYISILLHNGTGFNRQSGYIPKRIISSGKIINFSIYLKNIYESF